MDISVKYSLVTRLPLMQGISGQELAAMEDYVSLDILTGKENTTLASQGDSCDSLILLVGGTVKQTSFNQRLEMQASGTAEAPYAIEPCNMYGLLRKYRHTYVCGKDCTYIRLSKKDVSALMAWCEIFRINFVNTVCASFQKHVRRMGGTPLTSPEAKIRLLLSGWLHEYTGEVAVKMKMESLAKHIGETRLNASKALHGMESQGLLRLARNTIYINEMESILEQ